MAVSGFKGGEKLQAYLTNLNRNLSGSQTVSVGFMADATYPDGTSVAMVAAIQEFGAPAKSIPPRPFFRQMIAKEQGHWAADIAAILKANKYRSDKTLGLMGMEIKAELQESIQRLTSPKLAPATVARKGSDKPLVDTGHMLNSVDFKVSE